MPVLFLTKAWDCEQPTKCWVDQLKWDLISNTRAHSTPFIKEFDQEWLANKNQHFTHRNGKRLEVNQQELDDQQKQGRNIKQPKIASRRGGMCGSLRMPPGHLPESLRRDDLRGFFGRFFFGGKSRCKQKARIWG